jgi:hypothetical protein
MSAGITIGQLSPSTAHNRDLGRTALLRLADNPCKWFRKQCGVTRNLSRREPVYARRQYPVRRKVSHRYREPASIDCRATMCQGPNGPSACDGKDGPVP